MRNTPIYDTGITKMMASGWLSELKRMADMKKIMEMTISSRKYWLWSSFPQLQ